MSATSASTPAAASPVTSNSWLRQLALRATVTTFLLVTSIVGFAGMASASPEMGC